MKAVFTLFNALLEAIYFLFYPIIYIVLRFRNYLPAINCEGSDTNKGILFHAASMGEVNAIRPLVLELLERNPERKICITTSTITGLKLATSISPKLNAYLSVLDVPHLRNRQLELINPGLICIVETEIWLNMLYFATKHDIPVLFLNARMSARSFTGYSRLKNLLNNVGDSIVGIHAQSDMDATRYRQVFSKPVYNSGNLKYALKLTEYDPAELRKEWGFAISDLILCWGSSRPGEETLLLSMLPRLNNEIAKLKVIIAVRHPKRIDEVTNLMSNVPYRLFSGMQNSNNESILLIDKLGMLDKAYAICDIAVVGGSFYDFGGHNPLEPAYYAKPVIMGSYYSSCRDSVNRLLNGKGIIISDVSRLTNDIITLANDPASRNSMGQNAQLVLQENSHALDIQLNAIERICR